jgi:hypothetical protein
MAVKKKSVKSAVTLTSIQFKLCNIQKTLEENTQDIKTLKEQIAMGKGGVKVIVWMGGILTAVLGYKYFN